MVVVGPGQFFTAYTLSGDGVPKVVDLASKKLALAQPYLQTGVNDELQQTVQEVQVFVEGHGTPTGHQGTPAGTGKGSPT